MRASFYSDALIYQGRADNVGSVFGAIEQGVQPA